MSVLLPVYNGEAYLGAAIDSILRQSFEDLELLVVNDGSTDGSSQVASRFKDARIRVLDRRHNKGIVATLNEGLSAARGEYVARQDADDIAEPDRIRTQVAILDSHPDVEAVGCFLRIIDETGAPGGIWSYPTTPLLARWLKLFRTPVPHASVIYRRDTVRGLGGYSADFPWAEDYELWSRLTRLGDVFSVPETLQRYRIGREGVSRKNAEQQQASHIRVAGANMAELLGRSVADGIVRVLSLGATDTAPDRVAQQDVVASLGVLDQLFQAFVARERVDARDLRAIQVEYLQTFSQTVQALPARLQARLALQHGRAVQPRWWRAAHLARHWLGHRARVVLRPSGPPE